MATTDRNLQVCLKPLMPSLAESHSLRTLRSWFSPMSRHKSMRWYVTDCPLPELCTLASHVSPKPSPLCEKSSHSSPWRRAYRYHLVLGRLPAWYLRQRCSSKMTLKRWIFTHGKSPNHWQITKSKQQDGIIRPFEGLRIIRGEHHLLKQRKVAIVHLHFDTAHAWSETREACGNKQ